MIKLLMVFSVLTNFLFSSNFTIAVFELKNIGLKKTDVEILTDRLQSELVKIGNYRLVERDKIDNILKEQKLQMSGLINEKYLIDIGKILGAELILIGNVGKIDNIYTISVRLVDAESSEIIKSVNYDTGTSISNLLRVGMVNIAAKLSNKDTEIDIINKNTINISKHLIPKNNNIENNDIKIIKIKKKISRDGSTKIYVTYQQKIAYKPSKIMIDWLDNDGMVLDGERKYTKTKLSKDEIRSLSFYLPEDAFNYKVWLKK